MLLVGHNAPLSCISMLYTTRSHTGRNHPDQWWCADARDRVLGRGRVAPCSPPAPWRATLCLHRALTVVKRCRHMDGHFYERACAGDGGEGGVGAGEPDQRVDTHAHTKTRIHKNTSHTRTNACMHIHPHIHTHTYTHARTHTLRHTHTHTYTHTHTHTQVAWLRALLGTPYCGGSRTRKGTGSATGTDTETDTDRATGTTHRRGDLRTG
jgi:hypothetical protein